MIRQFDVFENPNARSRPQAPYIVSIQSHFLDALITTVVAPLFRAEIMPADRAVILPIEFADQALTLNVALIANIESRRLRRSVGSLVSYDLEIRRAIDRLLTGF
ncbi:MAG TPA: CcdB family protein [Caulobacteraceae bacterium]|nr:CcdB family protein [Caulobacteraceae bacterium]